MTSQLQNHYKRVSEDLFLCLKRDPIVGMLHKSDEDYWNAVRTMINPQLQDEKIRLLEAHIKKPLKQSKMLEIGSGLGDFVVTCRERGIETYGIEPHNSSYGDLETITENFLSYFKLDDNIYQKASGDAIPFPDNSFDIAFSYYVFEHVDHPLNILNEALRVLKPGGELFFVFPNYGSFWEGHYGVPWLPFANKSIGKMWIRLWGHRPDFIDTLNLINLHTLKSMLGKSSQPFEILNMGKEKFIHDIDHLSFTDSGSVWKAKKMIRPLKTMGILSFLSRLTANMGMFTPFYLHLKKRRA